MEEHVSPGMVSAQAWQHVLLHVLHGILQHQVHQNGLYVLSHRGHIFALHTIHHSGSIYAKTTASVIESELADRS